MKPLSVLIDMACYPEGPDRTSLLTAERHEPELLSDGWVRFKTGDGTWHRVPPWAIKRVTEMPVASPKTVEVPYLVSKRKPKSV